MKQLIELCKKNISDCKTGIELSKSIKGKSQNTYQIIKKRELSIHEAYLKQIEDLQEELTQALSRSPWEEYPWF